MMRQILPIIFLVMVLLSVARVVMAQDCCDVNDVNILVIAPNGTTQLYTDCSLSSTSGTCSSTSSTTVTYSCNIGYTFCPVEGNYDANIYLDVPGSCTDCSVFTRIVQTVNNFYEVNYDASADWCACKLGSGHWGLGGITNNCCGDDPNEYVVSCSGETSTESSYLCFGDNRDVACCSSNTDCVYNDTCYPSGTGAISLSGATFVCNNGVWTNCLPPPSGDWNIIRSCAITTSLEVTGNIWIKAGGILDILTGGRVYGMTYIFVLPSGEIRVESGGQLG